MGSSCCPSSDSENTDQPPPNKSEEPSPGPLQKPSQEFVPSCFDSYGEITDKTVFEEEEKGRKKGLGEWGNRRETSNKEYKEENHTGYSVYGSSKHSYLKKSSRTFYPTQDSPPVQDGGLNKIYTQYVNYFLNQGLSFTDSKAWASYYVSLRNYKQQQPFSDEENQSSDSFEIKEILTRGHNNTKKYKGTRHKNDKSSGNGYYNEIGYYFNPDGTFYDKDGFFHNTNKDNLKNESKLQEEVDPSQADSSDSDFEISSLGPEMGYKPQFQHKNQYGSGNLKDSVEIPKNTHSDSDLSAYIEYVTTYKYYDDLEYLYNTRKNSVTFVLENLPPKLSKASLVKYFYDQGVDTRRIEVQRRTGTTAIVQAFSIPIAIQVLQQCGNYLKGRVLLIEIDQEDERMRLERLIEAL
ncbi:unnamed protein product [Moneuplotes crassus]|uniref:RRM domain-containing protein n=1 Tax=Euplotes crassus TaxID=5936 RepID=A0AAD1UBG2_EUPCR|nr:unnamed protein product [Moneuplotes crassus]